MQQDHRLTTIYRAANQIEAEIIRGMLESNGIPALLKYESLGQIYGLTVDGLAQVEVQVPQKYIQDAENLLKCVSQQNNEDQNFD